MSPRGGPRKGAGRPPGTGTGPTVRVVSWRIPIGLAEQFAEAVPAGDRSRVVTGLIEEFLAKRGAGLSDRSER